MTNCRSVADNAAGVAGHRTATMKPFTALLGAAAGTHAADQLALATLPLTAALVLAAGPDVLGLLVAVQSAAWLLVTLPAGAWVDRMPRRTLLIVGLGFGLSASVVAVPAALAGITGLLGIAAFVGALGHRDLHADDGVAAAQPRAAGRPAAFQRPPRARPRHRKPGRAFRGRPFGAEAVAGLGLWPGRGRGRAGAGLHSRAAQGASGHDRHRPSHDLVRRSGTAPASWCARVAARASASARSSGTSPSSPCSRSGAPVALGPLGLDPARMGLAQSGYGAGMILGALVAPAALAAPAAAGHPDLRAGRVGDRRRPVPRGPIPGRPIGQRLPLCRGRSTSWWASAR